LVFSITRTLIEVEGWVPNRVFSFVFAGGVGIGVGLLLNYVPKLFFPLCYLALMFVVWFAISPDTWTMETIVLVPRVLLMIAIIVGAILIHMFDSRFPKAPNVAATSFLSMYGFIYSGFFLGEVIARYESGSSLILADAVDDILGLMTCDTNALCMVRVISVAVLTALRTFYILKFCDDPDATLTKTDVEKVAEKVINDKLKRDATDAANGATINAKSLPKPSAPPRERSNSISIDRTQANTRESPPPSPASVLRE